MRCKSTERLAGAGWGMTLAAHRTTQKKGGEGAYSDGRGLGEGEETIMKNEDTNNQTEGDRRRIPSTETTP